ncbi:hypothetical protein N657DRAFT_643717 [Parathielavia appendiculata]|uniref:Uncharacterized protein n=1 Tax=Parathielavia appendiculata TaxID=2587402 RepID=A0AAN6U357_9PEZI|nr:hypothetical protein N657DRAFT_643717 [Parathielavia appendiculata]
MALFDQAATEGPERGEGSRRAAAWVAVCNRGAATAATLDRGKGGQVEIEHVPEEENGGKETVPVSGWRNRKSHLQSSPAKPIVPASRG